MDEKKFEESSKVIKQLIDEGKIVPPEPNTCDFFLKKGDNARIISKRLLQLFIEEKIDTHLWVINTAYYSMFFTATALLAKFNHKINVEAGIHKLTYHALVHYFINQENKLQHRLMEAYKNAVEEAEELLQLSKTKIHKLVQDFDFEQAKRKAFTYDLGKDAERNKALTSFERAKSFFQEAEKIINQK